MKKPPLREQVGALIDVKLVALLDQAFPLKPPKPGLSMDEILYDAGTRHVIDWLRECVAQGQATEDQDD